MEKELMSPERLQASLASTDLTDPKNGIHAINLVIEKIHNFLSSKEGWPVPKIIRSSPITTVLQNFDLLRFPIDNPGRSSRYTRYISENEILRTHTSAMIPNILAELGKSQINDFLVMCPGICYRRDVVDKTHCGEPHQMDVWRIKKGSPRLEKSDLIELVESIIACALPKTQYRANAVVHPYTINGLEIEILKANGDWLELLECGEVHPEILANIGLDPGQYSGLAMGMGLDRLVMLVKEIDDIRILRSTDPRIKTQMTDLQRYHSVSKYPSIRQDISVSVSEQTNEEDICDTIKCTLGINSTAIESISIVSETSYDQLPAIAIERLGINVGQKNLLIRIVLRSHEKSLTKEEANEIRDKIYRAIDQSSTGGYLAIKN
ncbi:MAG TPA: hypothetical protein PLS17_00020 [bacterium]|nr:hypothetical protein [bacterium]